MLGDHSRLTGVSQESSDRTSDHSDSVLPRGVVARDMVLLIEAVMSAFKTYVWGGHPCGCQRMTWGVALPSALF